MDIGNYVTTDDIQNMADLALIDSSEDMYWLDSFLRALSLEGKNKAAGILEKHLNPRTGEFPSFFEYYMNLELSAMAKDQHLTDPQFEEFVLPRVQEAFINLILLQKNTN